MRTKKQLPKNLVKKAGISTGKNRLTVLHKAVKPAPEVGQVAEGKKLKFQKPSVIKRSELKTFVFDSEKQRIHIETKEFSAVCPFSGLPDIAKVEIEYFPLTKKAIELKSLKYYFIQYRNVGIYQEAVTKKIYEDICGVLGHKGVLVRTVYNTRGGIDVTATEGEHVMTVK